MLILMRFAGLWVLLLLWALAPLPAETAGMRTAWPGLNSALAQRSGGGVGGRGGFSAPRSPSIPRVNPSPSPSLPLPTPRSYPSYPTYPRDYFPPGYPTYPSTRPPIYINPGTGYGFDLVALLFIGGILLVSFSMIRGLQRAGTDGALAGEPESTVARLRLATLFTPAMQASLRHIAEAADTESVRGLADLMDNAAVLLLRDQAGWRFGMYEVWTGSLQKAEGQFDAWMTETRSEFVETYRHFEGREVVQAGYQPKAEPDGRYILVTLLLAVSGSLPPVPTPLRREGARQALMALASSSATNTLAAYIAWTPEAEGEALTEQDLLLGWPRLELL
ncbi:MAG: DUF1517 domain-containing protein [Meiothermus sp.]|uniref:DUF1517 domain-containing protein n=1 Tax=Meiothermus sp. TaxID=1955249 RepID=UPI0025FCA537|nr:DUF1517 domain-containing protein [Meiothermus sp.]MCS7067245.1 DUF1517 domain-containing protein [Meiothermus sp.]MCX7601022.1 DUF1517 domain-containing protein [Meiothermus sp.]MDW8424991.1 DUF1517 domain-containing protein [Meiothermus sp.]